MMDKPIAIKAERLKLTKRMTMEQAFQASAVNCLTQMTANWRGIAEQHDAESLHQMRVGLRRLRTLLALFKNALPTPPLLQQELTWLSEQLGTARDWDVLAGSTLPLIAALAPQESTLEAVRRAALIEASEQHAAVANALHSVRYTSLMQQCAQWIAGYGWRDTMTARQRQRLTARMDRYASATLQRQQRRLQERGNALRGASAESRHRVRIAAKKMRYACEFFQALYPNRKMARYLAALTLLQDQFGWLNDAIVALDLLGQLQQRQPDLGAGTGFLRGYLAARLAADGKKSVRLWKKFTPTALPG
jgi:CHAD domain-containing protein